MRPYSQDLRDRAVAAYEAGEGSEAAVAARFGLHKSTLEKWLYRKRDTGSCAALPHASGPARTLQACDEFIRTEVKKQPDVSLAELCERVEAARGISASVSMMCRELQRLDLPRKKSRSTTASATRRASSSSERPLSRKSSRSGPG
jgi:transposase